ncbi:uncharacterized protein ALTATR162_LOCUS161 [Alternaria atra]|uniref:DUF1996 domain-containing protein n=1 Tax=Alternaria atra TaxID=119953 RepID=A0A8J2MZY3_9PLEO|nr:uncharacterized protein ALTATR162_LOCUS161 [Alternaria atra]CAG5137590.1 unnamed protein product [Alternaria atra]
MAPLTSFLAFSQLLALASAQFFILNCGKLTVQRSDPIVSPGVPSGHVHAVIGGTAFKRTLSNEEARNAKDTTCISMDKSNYWIPQLYHENRNGTFTYVPFEGSMSYPQTTGDYNGGVCPQSHPVAIFSLFYEFFFTAGRISAADFNRYVYAMGDATGYGLHGDFINGWADQGALERSIATCTGSQGLQDPNCSLRLGGSLGSPGNKDPETAAPVEDVGMTGPVAKLPGDNPVTG